MRSFGILLLNAMSLLPWSALCAFCPAGRRFDIQLFPPRCLNCSRIQTNQMQLQLIPAQVAVRKTAAKFSPGLPQNMSCGCWRAGNQIVDIYLNASWIVSGLYFPRTSQVQWLKEFSVQASNDNRTFLSWGTYTPSNYTTAQTVLFGLPIRATTFRLNITQYVNHALSLNNTGFNISANAVVSKLQPFKCGCPVLPDGECCPYMNMSVTDGRCLFCKDPKDLNVVMDEECGVCRPGTVDRYNKCVPRSAVAALPPATLDIGDIRISTSRVWAIDLVLDLSAPLLSIYLASLPDRTHPCQQDPLQRCLERMSEPQYTVLLRPSSPQHPFLRFERGRWQLVLSSDDIRAWPTCSADGVCNKSLGVVYGRGSAGVQVVERAVDFDLKIVPPPLSVITAVPGILAPTAVEIHTYPHASFLRMDGPGLEYDIMFQCAYKDRWAFVSYFVEPMRMIQLPDGVLDDPLCTRFRIKGTFGNGRRVRFAVNRPSRVVRHGALTTTQYAPITGNVSFGTHWRAIPGVGDSERVVTLIASSPLPMHLTRLTVTAGGEAHSTLPSHYVLNMTAACASPDTARNWLQEQADVIMDTMGLLWNNTCGARRDQIFWVVIPSDAARDRREVVSFGLAAEFGLNHIVS